MRDVEAHVRIMWVHRWMAGHVWPQHWGQQVHWGSLCLLWLLGTQSASPYAFLYISGLYGRSCGWIRFCQLDVLLWNVGNGTEASLFLFYLGNQVAGCREAAVAGAEGWLMQYCVHEELETMWYGLYVELKKKRYSWTCIQNSSRSTDIENKLIVIEGEGEDRIHWMFGITDTHCYI